MIPFQPFAMGSLSGRAILPCLTVLSSLLILFAVLWHSPAAGQDAGPPAKPTGLTASATYEQVTLTWDDPEDDSITGYQILRRDKSVHESGEFAVHVDNTGSAAQSYTDGDVVEGVGYTYRIKARNSAGLSARSSYADVRIPAPPPQVAVGFAKNSYSVEEGESVTAGVTLDRDPERTVVIELSVENRDGASANDYSGVPGSITFNSGDTSASFTLTAIDDGEEEDGESVVITIGSDLPKRVSPGPEPSTTLILKDSDQGQKPPAAPTGLSASATYSQATLSWDDPEDDSITGYQILRSDKSVHETGEFAVHVDDTGNTTTAHTDTDVVEKGEYVYRVRARNAAGLSPESSNAGVTVPEAPLQVVVAFAKGSYSAEEGGNVTVELTLDQDPKRTVVVNLTASGVRGASSNDYSGVPAQVTFDSGETSASFIFTAAADADEDEDVEGVSITIDSDLPDRVVTGPQASTTVRITDNDQEVEPPAKPSGLTASATYKSVTLTWDDPEDDSITGYQILRHKKGAHDPKEFAILVDDTGSAALTYTDTDVEEFRQYKYRIKARNSAGLGPRSSFASASIPKTPPQVSVSFASGSYPVEEGSSVTVELTLNRDPERTVVIQLTSAGWGGASGDDYSGVPESVTFDSGQTTASFILTATEDDEDEDDGEGVIITIDSDLPDQVVTGPQASTTVSITDKEHEQEPPAQPSGLTAAATYKSVTLTWDDPEDDSIAGYQILRHKKGAHDPKEFAILVDDTGSAALTYTDTDVEVSRQYKYRIKARNSAGLGPRSSFASASIPQAPPQVSVSFASGSYPVEEDSSVTVELTLNRDPERAVVIQLTSAGWGGASGDDYSGVPESVTFNSGQTSASFILTATGDDEDDGGEGVDITIGSDLPARVSAGSPSSTSVSITEKAGSKTPGAARKSALDLGDITNLEEPRFPKYRLDEAGQENWFQFSLTAPRKVNFGARQMDADADLFLQDSRGRVLGESRNSGTSNESISTNLEPGAYHVLVRAVESGENAYALRHGIGPYKTVTKTFVGDRFARAEANTVPRTLVSNQKLAGLTGQIGSNDYQAFTTGAMGATLTGVVLDFRGFVQGTSTTANLTVSIRAQNALGTGPASTSLVDLETPDLSSTGLKTFEPPAGDTPFLDAMSTYYVYFRFQDAEHTIILRETFVNGEDSTGLSDWTIADASSGSTDTSLVITVTGIPLRVNDRLAGLTVSSDGADVRLSPIFNSDHYSYTAEVDTYQATLSFRAEPGATTVVKDVNDDVLADLDSAEPGYQVPTVRPETVVKIVVTSESGTRTKTYQLTLQGRDATTLVSNIHSTIDESDVVTGTYTRIKTGELAVALESLEIEIGEIDFEGSEGGLWIDILPQNTAGTGPDDSTILLRLESPDPDLSSSDVKKFTVPAGKNVILSPNSYYYAKIHFLGVEGDLIDAKIAVVGRLDTNSRPGWELRPEPGSLVDGNSVLQMRLKGVPLRLSPDLILTGLRVRDGTIPLSLSPKFDPDRTSYKVSVGANEPEVTVSFTAEEGAGPAVLQDDAGNPLTDTDPLEHGTQVRLDGAVTTFQIELADAVLEDVDVKKTYRLDVERPPKVLLSNLGLSFNPVHSAGPEDGDSQEFETGALATTLSSVGLILALGVRDLNDLTARPPMSVMTVSIREQNTDGDGPGNTDLVVLDNPDNSDTGLKQFRVPAGSEIRLKPDTSYYLYFKFANEPGTEYYASFDGTRNFGEDRTGIRGFTIANSTDADTEEGSVFRMELLGYASFEDPDLKSMSIKEGSTALDLIPGFDPGITDYYVEASSGATQVTVAYTEPTGGSVRLEDDSGGRLEDADDVEPGFQVALSGDGRRSAFVLEATSENRAYTRAYRVEVFRGGGDLVSNASNAQSRWFELAPGETIQMALDTGPGHGAFLSRVDITWADFDPALHDPSSLRVSLYWPAINSPEFAEPRFMYRLRNPATITADAANQFRTPSGTYLEPNSKYLLRIEAKNGHGGFLSLTGDRSQQGDRGWSISDSGLVNPYEGIVFASDGAEEIPFSRMLYEDVENPVRLAVRGVKAAAPCAAEECRASNFGARYWLYANHGGCGDRCWYQKFHTGPAAAGQQWVLRSVDLMLREAPMGSNHSVTLWDSVRPSGREVARRPHEEIGTFRIPGNMDTAGIKTFTTTKKITLKPDTDYFIRVAPGSSRFGVTYTNSAAQDNNDPGWRIGTGHYVRKGPNAVLYAFSLRMRVNADLE